MARRAVRAYLKGDQEELRQQCRRLAFSLLENEADRITFRRHGTEWTTAVTGVIGRRLFVKDGYQLEDVNAVVAWLRSSGYVGASRDAIFDVGANIGTTSVPFARAGFRVLAVEPVPANFELLQHNITRNGFADRITCVQAAVSLTEETVPFLIHPTDGGRGEVQVEGPQGYAYFPEESRVEHVPATTLDRILAYHGVAAEEVALVWSDTQGCEGDVIESGASLVEAGVPFFVELWRDGLSAHGGVDRFLELARRRFESMIVREDLRREHAKARRRPLSELESVLAGVRGGHTDVLFLPRRPKP